MEEKFRKIQMQTVGLFTILIVGISLYLTILLSGQSDNILKQTSAHLVAAHNHQMEMNINSYLTNVEKAASLLFGDEEYYTYDPNDSSLDPYEKQQVVTAMEDRINDFGILDNYTDFSVVYNNGDSIGWISKLTRAMYVNTAMYDDFAAILGGTDHRWVFGLNGNTDHLYYLKRYNSQAIIMVSFYSLELENYFQIPEQLDGMDVALVDDANHILYANDTARIGQTLSEDTLNSLGTITDGTVLTRNLLVTSNTCENGWRIVCSMPTANITRQTRNESRISLLCVLVIIALILWFGLRRANAMNLSAAGIVETLQTRAEHDSMTGLYNKTEFEQEATSRLASPTENSLYCFTIMDLDCFKTINDTYGHAMGDAVLIAFAKVLRETFREKEYITGRLGGDEFGVFAQFEGTDPREALLKNADRLQEMRKALDEVDLHLGEYHISFSSGTAFTKPWAADFKQLHKRADDLLYQSKWNGKGRDSSEVSHEKA
jgi:diguanylate cyclase (GGDEF)-like protein